MRLPLLPLFVIILVNILVDTYIYKVVRSRVKSLWPSRLQLVTAVLLLLLILWVIIFPKRDCTNSMLVAVMWALYTYIAFYLPKYVFVIIDLIANIPRLFHGRRCRPVSWLAYGVSAGLFATLWWGAFGCRNMIETTSVELPIENLPESFDGMTVAQISDLHVGTFGSDTSFLSRLVDKINGLSPDVIVFTGDLVNSKSSELVPHISTLSRLQAPGGVYSILGNHDYGDYSEWPSRRAKEVNLDALKDMQRNMGWDLLLNRTAYLVRGHDSVALIGVENIGDPPFHSYGSLAAAYPTTGDSLPKILLTHNPAHWVDSIRDDSSMKIDLTLAGHTHAMQMRAFGWSPAKYRYRTWGGMYQSPDSLRPLYVNIGAGTVGFPARVGATPEITLITLRRK